MFKQEQKPIHEPELINEAAINAAMQQKEPLIEVPLGYLNNNLEYLPLRMRTESKEEKHFLMYYKSFRAIATAGEPDDDGLSLEEKIKENIRLHNQLIGKESLIITGGGTALFEGTLAEENSSAYAINMLNLVIGKDSKLIPGVEEKIGLNDPYMRERVVKIISELTNTPAEAVNLGCSNLDVLIDVTTPKIELQYEEKQERIIQQRCESGSRRVMKSVKIEENVPKTMYVPLRPDITAMLDEIKKRQSRRGGNEAWHFDAVQTIINVTCTRYGAPEAVLPVIPPNQ